MIHFAVSGKFVNKQGRQEKNYLSAEKQMRNGG